MAQKRTVFLSWGIGLAVLLVGVLGFAGWYAHHSGQVADEALQSANKVAAGDVPKVSPITTFEECKQAPGSTLQESYPERCVTTSGKTFTQGKKYLVITEWGVKIPLTEGIKDTYYVIKPDYTAAAYLSLNSLKGTECGADKTTLGAISRFQASDKLGDDDETILSRYPTAPKIGGYYYRFESPQASCDSGSVQLSNDVNLKIEWLQALKLIEAN